MTRKIPSALAFALAFAVLMLLAWLFGWDAPQWTRGNYR